MSWNATNGRSSDGRSITVRLATPDDAAAISSAHINAWQTAYRGIVSDGHLDSMDHAAGEEHWQQILLGNIVVEGVERPTDFVGEIDGLVGGFADVGAFRDEPDDPLAGELWAMYVDPMHWGTGLSDALMAATSLELERQARERSYLWVFEGNARARRFYERHGWHDEGLVDYLDVGGQKVAECRYRLGHRTLD